MRVLALVFALSALPAFAQSAQVKKYLNTAITLYENLEYEKALKQLKSAKAKSGGPDDDAKIALLEGVVLADMGREEKALTAFKEGFSVDLEAKLPVEVSPKVQAVAEKARANVRLMLAPQLEAQKKEEEKRLFEEQQKAREEAERQLALKKQEEEERLRNQPPPLVEQPKPESTGPSARVLSIIPGVVGLAAGGAAVGLLVDASAKHTALVNGTAPAEQALNYRDAGRTEQTIGYVMTGVAAAGVATAVVMLIVGGPKDAPAVSVAPIQGGAFVSATVPFDLGGSR